MPPASRRNGGSDRPSGAAESLLQFPVLLAARGPGVRPPAAATQAAGVGGAVRHLHVWEAILRAVVSAEPGHCCSYIAPLLSATLCFSSCPFTTSFPLHVVLFSSSHPARFRVQNGRAGSSGHLGGAPALCGSASETPGGGNRRRRGRRPVQATGDRGRCAPLGVPMARF